MVMGWDFYPDSRASPHQSHGQKHLKDVFRMQPVFGRHPIVDMFNSVTMYHVGFSSSEFIYTPV